jgi:hypothetical protein
MDEVWITYSKKLCEKIAEPGPLTEDDVLAFANLLATALPPAITDRWRTEGPR